MEQEQLDVKTPEYVSLKFKLAGLGSRGTAQLIDTIIITITTIAIFLVLYLATTNNIWTASESVLFATVLIITFALQFGYFIVLEYFWSGKTIGKHLLGIRVIQENGHNITFLSSLIRNFLRLIDMLPTSYALGIILIFAHSKHKRLGDMAAGTLVVHEKGKKSKKQTSAEKYIKRKGLQKDTLPLESFQLNRFSQQDWQLLQTYTYRIAEMPAAEKDTFTRQVSDILLPKIEDGVSFDEKNKEEILLLLYLHLKEEWEY